MTDRSCSAVLLLHGVCSTGATLSILAEAFRKSGIEVVAPTLAESRRTESGARDGSLARLPLHDILEEAQWHARALAERTGRLPVVVGHSNGALLALALAGMGDASAVGLVAPAPPPSVAGAPRWVRQMMFTRIFGPGWTTRAVRFAPRWPMAGETPDPDFARTLCADSGPAMAEALAADRGGVFDPRPPLQCPVIVVAGQRDRLVPLTLTRKIAERFGASHHTIAEAGHWLIGDAPHSEAICSAVLAHLNQGNCKK